jgi:hypothetical protein
VTDDEETYERWMPVSVKASDEGYAWSETTVMVDLGGDTVIVGRSPRAVRRVKRRLLRCPLRLSEHDALALIARMAAERDALEEELWKWRDWAVVAAAEHGAVDDEGLRMAIFDLDDED